MVAEEVAGAPESVKSKIDDLQEKTKIQIDEMQHQIDQYAMRENDTVFQNDTAKLFLKNMTELIGSIQDSFREIKLKTM